MNTIERLAELAKGATKGEWQAGSIYSQECDLTCSCGTFLGINAGSGAPDKLYPDDYAEFEANIALIAACNPAAIAQAAAEDAAKTAEILALRERNAELESNQRVLVSLLEAALGCVESMQNFELCREIEDVVESVTALTPSPQSDQEEA